MTVNSAERIRDVQPPRLDRTTAVIVMALATAALMAVLDGTAVSVSLESLQASFHTSVSAIVWVTVGYLVAASLALPLVGWASDRYGGRRVFLIGLGIFVAGSVLSGLAWSVESLIGFRLIQGFGGGLLEPSAAALAAAVAPREQIGKVMGLLSLVINIAPVLGPLFGGVMSGHDLWRGIFLINIPLGALVLVAAIRLLPHQQATHAGLRADIRGMLLLSPGFVALLLALNRWGDGAAATVVLPLALIGVTLLGLYVRHALTSEVPPVLNLQLLKVPSFAAAIGVMTLVGLTMYGMLIALPLYARSEHGLTGLSQGTLVTALGVGLLISMVNAARISDKVGPRPLVRAGSIGTAAGLAVFAAVHSTWPLLALVALFFLIGLAFGATASPTFSSVYRVLSPEDAAQGTTSMFIAVQLAASVGVTLIGFLVSRGEGSAYTILFWILTGAAVTITLLSSKLPGRPETA